MKRIFSGLAGVAIVLVCGCDNGTAGGKGVTQTTPSNTATTPSTTNPGTTTPSTTTRPADKPLVGEAKETFKVTVPTLSTSIKQAESTTVTIGISRGTNFDDDVSLKLGKLPEGVTVDPAQPTIPHGSSEVKVSVMAAADAAVGDFTVPVTGVPAKGGANAENELKLTIKENK